MSKQKYKPGLYICRWEDDLEIEQFDRYGEKQWYGIGSEVPILVPGGEVIAGPFSAEQFLAFHDVCIRLVGFYGKHDTTDGSFLEDVFEIIEVARKALGDKT